MLTIDAFFPLFSNGNKVLVNRNIPVRFMLIELFQSSSVCRSIPPNFVIPAEFTKQSNLLNFWSISSYILRQSVSLLISPCKNKTLFALLPNFFWANDIFSLPLEAEMTVYPVCSNKYSIVPNPMPLVPPVIRTTFF